MEKVKEIGTRLFLGCDGVVRLMVIQSSALWKSMRFLHSGEGFFLNEEEEDEDAKAKAERYRSGCCKTKGISFGLGTGEASASKVKSTTSGFGLGLRRELSIQPSASGFCGVTQVNGGS